MESCTLRFLNLFEALAFSALVGWYIWRLQASYFFAWLVFPVWMIVSIVLHGDTPKTIGWRADNLGSATIRSAVFFAPCLAGLCLAVVLLGALHRPVHHLFVPKRFLGYMTFCLLQQVGLNSYLTNRLLGPTGSPARLAAGRHNFCRASLAESRAGSAHLYRRSRDGLALCARTQHHSARHWARSFGHSGLVGVSGCVASRDARGAWFLNVPSAIRPETYRFKWG